MGQAGPWAQAWALLTMQLSDNQRNKGPNSALPPAPPAAPAWSSRPTFAHLALPLAPQGCSGPVHGSSSPNERFHPVAPNDFQMLVRDVF